MRAVIFRVILLFAALSGCQSGPAVPLASPEAEATGRTFPAPAQGHAALYVLGSTIDIVPVTLGRTAIGSLDGGTWLLVEVPAGQYDLRATGKYNSVSYDLSLAPGSTTFLKVQVVTMAIPHYYRVELLSPETAKPLIMQWRRAREIR